MHSETTFKSTCSYCGVGCGVLVHRNDSGEIQVEGDPDHPANRGLLCSKGRNLHYSVMDRSDRILHPLLRKNRGAELERASWDQALDRVASDFKKYIKEFGSDSVGFYVSGQLLTEEYYIINKLTKGFLKTNNIDTNSRLCMSSAVVGYKMSLGEDSVPVSYEDIELADCFFVAGANPAWCHPILFRRIEERRRKDPNVKLIVVDPRRTESCEDADIHFQILPGSDIYLFHAIARILIENGWVDSDFVENHTEGFEDFKSKVFATSVDEYARNCGVEKERILECASILSKSKGFLTLWAMGLNQSVIGVNKNVALINLSLITGMIGKPGAGPFSLTGQPNAMGGREVGGLCNLLPAHRNLANPEHREEVARFWGVDSINERPGYTAVEMFQNLKSGKMKAVWIVCTNPTVSLPNAREVESALRCAELVVVQDISLSSGAVPFADVVLPAAGWTEKQGTMTNSDRRITYLPKIMDPPGEAKSDSWIIQKFAEKMGYAKSFPYSDEEDIFLEHCRLTEGTNIDIKGLDYSEIRMHRSVQWPYPKKGHGGTKRLFEDGKFFRPNGKAKIHSVDETDDSESVSDRFPFILTTGRIRDQWHTMTRTGKVRKLNEHKKEAYLEIHPKDAESLGCIDGEILSVYNERGSVRVKASITDSIKEGVVFLPMHWGRKNGSDISRSNNLTAPEYDPASKQPGFKISAVNVIPYKKKREKILIVGGGNASLAFLRAYRKLAPEDEITVLCKEPNPFYNRILLPDYISGEKEFEDLNAITEEEKSSWNIELSAGRGVERINPEAKKVFDADGRGYSYDKLVLALGSSPVWPKYVQKTLVGLFSLRSKLDAERIKGYFVPGTCALIVGGGLLGLEVAAALVGSGVKVTVLVRTDRLMSKQLDSVGGDILREEILKRGIDIVFDAEISKIEGDEKISRVKLNNGSVMYPDGIVFAVGTKPNISLAESCGLECNSGVKVDAFLRSGDPDIYCIGEMAEHSTGTYGTASAAEEQARIAADHIYGYAPHGYEGSPQTNLLKIPGLDLGSIRIPDAPLEASESGEYEEVVFSDRRRRVYKKCIIQNDRLVAAILIGDKSEFSKIKELIYSGMELGEKRNFLLSSGASTANPMIGKLVCSCNGVGEGNILAAVRNGASGTEEIGKISGAGTGCGSCRPEIARILKSAAEPS